MRYLLAPKQFGVVRSRKGLADFFDQKEFFSGFHDSGIKDSDRTNPRDGSIRRSILRGKKVRSHQAYSGSGIQTLVSGLSCPGAIRGEIPSPNVFNGEFDSGSERTLAAWIRHASRAGLFLVAIPGKVQRRTGA